MSSAIVVLRGEVTFGADGQDTTVGAGTLVHIPGGTTHWFRLGAGGSEMLSITFSPSLTASKPLTRSPDPAGEPSSVKLPGTLL